MLDRSVARREMDSTTGSNPRIAGPVSCPRCRRPIVTVTLHGRVRAHTHVEVAVSSVEINGYNCGAGRIAWQAGMSKRMTHVRGYVGFTSREAGWRPSPVDEQAGKSENHPWQAGMYKGMRSLAGYVVCGGRDN